MSVSYTHGFWFKVLDGEEVSKEQSADSARWCLSAWFNLRMEGGNAQQEELLPMPSPCSGLLRGDQPSGKG